ncbi:MAG: hypothetical protein ACRC3B_20295 [Bacteroidia bacterium]
MDLINLLQRLGRTNGNKAEPEVPGQPLTMYQREQRLNALRSDAGNWLSSSQLHIQLAAEATDLSGMLFPRTLCIAHHPGSGTSLMQMRSLLNRLQRTAPPGLHIVIVHAAGLPETIRRELFAMDEEITSGAAALISNGTIELSSAFGSKFEAFRTALQEKLLG